MRSSLLFVLTALSAACSPAPELDIQHLSTLEARTRGVVLMDDGQSGFGAMSGTTCSFDTLNGWVIDDFDLPSSEERVTDVFRGRVLGTSPDGVYQVREVEQVASVNARDARFMGDGFAFVVGSGDDCAVQFDDGRAHSVPAAACDAGANSVTVARDVGAVVLAAGESTVVVDADGARELADAADFAVYDRRTELVYLAMAGGSEVRAVDLDGRLIWSTDVGGRITAMQQMGRRGKVVVMVDFGDHAGMVVVNGHDGAPESEAQAPTSDVELSVSDDGTTLAVTLEGQVFFYDVVAEGEEPKQRDTLGAEEQAQEFSD
jgi:hypothetical protein